VVLGRGDRWELGGRDWCAWNATFGPRGPDGLPKPLWDGKTGKIDRSVVEHWKKYDLRQVLEKDWATLGPKLRGKIRIWVGDADTYYLKISSRTREQHIVDFNSAKPNIMKIWWCDYDFTVPISNTTKPDYRVTTPANK
jgi:hypothetical protein